ncbi:MAG: Blp family class II bacteriocin [Candidatus Treponema excrementipullorum]|nr:Blp family class II bacteriocin [Candidatus Treponema excrementipullorum]
MDGFVEVSQKEMMEVDGGWTSEQWITGACTIAGGVVGTVIGGPIGTAVGAKAGSATAIVISVACGLATGAIANTIGKALSGGR